MTDLSTQAVQQQRGKRTIRNGVELLASMRFAIALLTVICVASVIGTVVPQGEPFNNYINQFGPFWARVFDALGLYAVYSAWWFLLILAFLIASTTLCVTRHTPRILRDLRTFKEDVRVQSLRAMRQKASADMPEDAGAAAHRLGHTLVRMGWRVRLQQRETAEGTGWMVAARAGALNKLGYLAAHSAIVLVCLGGLLDSDLMVRAQTWFNGKQVLTSAASLAAATDSHRLSSRNPSFRGNVFVPEGAKVDMALLSQKDGFLIQELPFALELKKFTVDYYPTGMPRLFASEVVIHDKETGAQTPARIEVNHPASYRGVEIYQSSFDDGGSLLKMQALSMMGQEPPLDVQIRVGESGAVSNGVQKRMLEVTNLRTINVESMADDEDAQASAGDSLASTIRDNLGAAVSKKDRHLRNIGPSMMYKLRDAAGQAREFHNYMLPVPNPQAPQAAPEFLFGVRDSVNQPFRYLRIPADAQDSLEDFLRLRAALMNDALRTAAVNRYVAQATAGDSSEMTRQFAASANKVMELFAGDPSRFAAAQADINSEAARSFGLQAIAAFIDKTVPKDQQERFSRVLLRILNGSLVELLQAARAKDHLPPLDLAVPRNQAWMSQAVVALSDAPLYPEPVLFVLKDFDHVQASVLQVTRAPGKWVVYIGCLLLVLGVFAMLYVRERRLWLWITPAPAGAAAAETDGTNSADTAPPSTPTPPAPAACTVLLALSGNRSQSASDRTLETLKAQLLGVTSL